MEIAIIQIMNLIKGKQVLRTVSYAKKTRFEILQPRLASKID